MHSRINDFETLYPQIAKEWDYNKNSDNPSDYFGRSSHFAWWKCAKEHSWLASIHNRTAGYGCPVCAPQSKGAELCRKILSDMKIHFESEVRLAHIDNTISSQLANLRFDFGIITNNHYQGFIEFDGIQHFKSNSYFYSEELEMNDIKKNEFASKYKIPLLRIRYDQIGQAEYMIKDLINDPQKYIYNHNSFMDNEAYYSIKEKNKI